MRDPIYRPRFSGMFAAFLSFIGIMTVATVFSENPAKSFWSNYERMEGLVTLLHLFAYFIVLGHVINTKKLWDRLFQTSLGVSLIICFYAFLQLAGKLTINQGGVRVDATFGNATYLAIYMVIHIFLALVFILRVNQATWIRIGYGILVLMQTIVLYHTATRGAILGLMGGLALMALLLSIFEKNRKAIRKISIATIGVIVAVVLIFIAIKDTEFVTKSPVLSRFSNISYSETKTQARAYVWPMAIKGFQEKPILGWGQENFNYVFNKYYDPRMYRHEPWFDRTHNVVLDWLVAGGLLGILGYLSLYALAMYAVWKKGDLSFAERAAFTGLFAAYFFHNLFVFDNVTSYMLFVLLLSYLHFDTARDFKNKFSMKIEEILSSQAFVNRLLAPIVVVLTIASVYYLNAKPIAANTTLIKAISAGTVDERIDSFKRALSYNTFGDQEIREQAVQFAFNVASANAATIKNRESAFTLAKTEYEKMIKEAPNDTRHHLFLGVLMNLYGQYGAGLEELSKASELSPGKQTIIMEIGNTYTASGRYEEAMPYYKKAFDLEPEFEDARISYAIGAVYTKNQKLLEELLIPVYGTIAYPNERLMRAYSDTKQFALIVQIWQNQVKQNPNDAKARSMLASAYFQAGRRSEALSELIKARDLEKDPNTIKQLDSAISELMSGR